MEKTLSLQNLRAQNALPECLQNLNLAWASNTELKPLGDMVQYDPNLERPFSGYLPHTKGKEPVTLAIIADQAKSGFLFCHVAIRD